MSYRKKAIAITRLSSSSTHDKVTLRELAKKLGVAPSTVSRALSGNPGVSDELREEIINLARDLGYSPPNMRRRTSRKNGIAGTKSPDLRGVIRILILNTSAHTIHRQWEASLVAGAVHHAKKHGFRVGIDIFERGETPQNVADWVPSDCLGSIVIGARADEYFPPALQGVSSRLVLIERRTLAEHFTSVVADDARGGYMAGQHLIDLGHKDIVLLTRPKNYSESIMERERGFKEALHRANVPFRKDLIVHADGWNPNDGHEAFRRFLSLKKDFTAVFATTDRLAVGALDALKEAGISVPDQVSIMGFDDEEVSANTHPPLTTIRLPMFEMGQEAAAILTENARRRDFRPRHIVMDVEFVQRQSTGPVPSTSPFASDDPAASKGPVSPAGP